MRHSKPAALDKLGEQQIEPMSAEGKTYSQRIDELLDRPDVEGAVRDYFNEANLYAAYSFDLVGENPPFELTNEDLFALNFLDVPIRVHVYRELLNRRGEIKKLLQAISPTASLWSMSSHSEEPYSSANQLWELLVDIKGVGPTRASKLLARKRPLLVPIHDKWIQSFYEDTSNYWLQLAGALKKEARRNGIDELRPPGAEAERLSTLRILDVAIWMIRGKPRPIDLKDESAAIEEP